MGSEFTCFHPVGSESGCVEGPEQPAEVPACPVAQGCLAQRGAGESGCVRGQKASRPCSVVRGERHPPPSPGGSPHRRGHSLTHAGVRVLPGTGGGDKPLFLSYAWEEGGDRAGLAGEPPCVSTAGGAGPGQECRCQAWRFSEVCVLPSPRRTHRQGPLPSGLHPGRPVGSCFLTSQSKSALLW